MARVENETLEAVYRDFWVNLNSPQLMLISEARFGSEEIYPVFAIAVWGVTAVTAAALAGLLAGAKNRDYSFWMAWCFLLPPLAVWLLFMPRRQGPRPRQPSLDELDKRDSFL